VDLESIDRQSDLTFRWKGDGIGVVRVFLTDEYIPSGPIVHAIECAFPSSAGSGTIPSRVLRSAFGLAIDALLLVESGASNLGDSVEAGDYGVELYLWGEFTWNGKSMNAQKVRFSN